MTSIIQLIRNTYTDLRKSERKVADYVLGHADEVIHMRIVDLAQEARVSEPTVVRFCRAIGYNSFQSFKLAVAQYVAHHPKAQPDSTSALEFAASAGQQRLQTGIAALANLQRDLDEVTLTAATLRLDQAERILILPLQLQLAAVAIHAHHRLFSVGRCALAAGALVQPGELLTLLGPRDALLVLGRHAAATELLAAARRAGVAIVQVAATADGIEADHHLGWSGGEDEVCARALVELLLAPLAIAPRGVR